MRAAGMGDRVDAFVVSMNRAAEQAAPQAREIFGDAIRQMQFQDVRLILNGAEDEATRYFKEKSTERLAAVFQPRIDAAMNSVGVTRSYQSLERAVEGLPFASAAVLDLDAYVTTQALEGLFYLLAREEAKIRRDPVARTTELLQKVFAAPLTD